ncbi:MAG: HAD-IA family hydrolase [Tissierellia bacterium]|nr:HAD-IA family hydrolase [Tissierellia bacterium]
MNIILDMGNVLIEFAGPIYIKKHYPELEFLIDIIFRSENWQEVDRGNLNEEQLIDIFKNRFPQYRVQIEDILLNWHKEVRFINQDVFEKFKEYKFYALTNMGKNHFEYIKNKKAFDKFDGVVASFKYHSIKPEKEIFEILIDKYKIEPKESFFVDDNVFNVNTAKKLGFKSMVYDKEKSRLIDFIKENYAK